VFISPFDRGRIRVIIDGHPIRPNGDTHI
jgi:hypothetical protein